MEITKDNGFKTALVITVDNGIAAAEEIAKLPPEYKVIVTDHHLADGKELPKCEYILNPKVFAKEEDDEYMISGCFVAAKLGLTLCNLAKYKNYDLITYCEVLTGLSILSDMIPMNHTVRNVMSLAMIGLNSLEHPGLRSLMTLSGFRYGSDITTNFLSFILIPKLNAAGRMNRVDLGMQLLLDTEDNTEYGKYSLTLANELVNCNRTRKTIEDIMVKEAFALVDQIYHKDSTLPSAIVVHKPEWVSGIVGIVAARLVDLFKVPVICLTGNGVLHGSGRAPEGYDLYQGLEQCKDLLTTFGGHRAAGGLALMETSLEAFREAFAKVYESQHQESYTRYIDAVTHIKDIKDVRFQLFLKQAEPFGNGNEPLNIRLNNVTVLNAFKKGESYCLVLADDTDNILVSKYRAEDEWYNIPLQAVIDIVVTPSLTYFTGTTIPEYKAVAFKYAGLDPELPASAKVYTNEEEFTKAVSK
jgi:single-stranded-DNA-specific exonuclease